MTDSVLSAGPAVHDDTPATVAAYEEKIAHLQRALVSNRRIGIAIGILMARAGYTDEQAFECLRAASQQHNRKLRDIAEDVIYTGAIPTPATSCVVTDRDGQDLDRAAASR